MTMVKLLPYGKDRFAIVDEIDYDWAKDFKWHAQNGGGYPRGGTTKNKKHVSWYLHRLIVGAKPGQLVDHINGDTSDARRCNLRICDDRGNARNSRPMKGRKYKGTFWVANRWMVQIVVDKKTIYLGRYKDHDEAARVYDEAAKKHFGEFARLNFPEE